MKKLEIALLLAGAGMLAILVRRMDIAAVAASLKLVGAGFILIFAQEIIAHVFNTLGWRYSFPDNIARQIPFLKLLKMRIAGDGINYLTPSATLAGEWAKAVMLGPNHTIEERLSSVAVAKITQTLAMALASLAGIVWVFALGTGFASLKSQIQGGGWIIAAIIAIIIILETRAASSKAAAVPLEEKSLWARLKSVDREIMAFISQNPRRFTLSTLFFLAAYLWGAFEAYWICAFLGINISVPTAVLIELLSIFMDGIFFAVPAKAGTQEATKTAIFSALGLGAAAGFTFAIVRHLREILWAVAGFCVYYSEKR